MQTQCEYILHASIDASDDEDEDTNTHEEASHLLKKEIEVARSSTKI